jgi:hypothetical protein
MDMEVTIFVSRHDILQLLTVLFDLNFNDFAENKSTHVLAWKLLLSKEKNRPIYVRR